MDTEPQCGIPIATVPFGRRQFGQSSYASVLREIALFDSNAALPVGDPGERERNEQSGRKASGEDVAPPGRAASALGDERLCFGGRLWRAMRTRRNPSLCIFQRG